MSVLAKEPYILAKEPYILAKETTLHVRKSDWYSGKRALACVKRELIEFLHT